MIFEIIESVPFYFWPLFILLLIVGLKAMETTQVSFVRLFVIPSLLFMWAIASFFGHYGEDFKIVALWSISLAVGIFYGFCHLQKLGLDFDTETKKIVIPGSTLPLVISMAIFISKFLIGALGVFFSELEYPFIFFFLELIASLMLGVFWGRAAGCFVKYVHAV